MMNAARWGRGVFPGEEAVPVAGNIELLSLTIE